MSRLNLVEIEKALKGVQKNFDKLNKKLDMRRDPMDDSIVANLMAGYEYVDNLVKKDINLFKRKNLHHILELNYLVLCGNDPKVRKEFVKHVQNTSDRFYDQKGFNISDVLKWHKENKDKSAWKRAAGVYILSLSQPQLFFEGNHRTGALVMSTILAQDKKPPFVLDVDNAEAYFNPSTLVKFTKKGFVAHLWKLPKLRKYFARFLKEQGKNKFLLPD